MKRGNFVIKLVFGILGGIFLLVGAGLLCGAIALAGDLRSIFSLPEEELALAICGTVFFSIGLVFGLIAVGFALGDRRAARLAEELRQYGTRVQGVVVEVRVDRSVRVNGFSPRIALVRCRFSSGEVTLRSHRLWNHCPLEGDVVDVLYDPMDEQRYVIEVPEIL